MSSATTTATQPGPSVILQAYPDHVRPPSADAATLTGLDWFLGLLPPGSVDLLHLLPPYESDADFGFAVVDYDTISPGYGDWDDVRALRRHMRLMLDFVVNHVSANHPWFRAWRSGDEAFAQRFIEIDPDWDLQRTARPRSGVPCTEVARDDGTTALLWTTYGAAQVDLNYADPGTLPDVCAALVSVLDRSAADAVRLDSLAFAWKEPPSPSVHHAGTYELASTLIDTLKSRHKLAVAEVDDDLPESRDYRRRCGADAVYRYALPPLVLHALITGQQQYLTAWLAQLPVDRHATGINIAATHDGIYLRPHDPPLPEDAMRVLAEHAERRGLNVQYRGLAPYEINATFADLLASPHHSAMDEARTVAAQTIALTLPGIAQLYLPSLLALSSDKTLADLHSDPRAVNRAKGHAVDSLLHNADSWESRVFERLRRLLVLRRETPQLRPESPFQLCDAPDGLLAFTRGTRNPITVVVNLTPEAMCRPRTMCGPDLVTGSTSEILSGYQVHIIGTGGESL